MSVCLEFFLPVSGNHLLLDGGRFDLPTRKRRKEKERKLVQVQHQIKVKTDDWEAVETIGRLSGRGIFQQTKPRVDVELPG